MVITNFGGCHKGKSSSNHSVAVRKFAFVGKMLKVEEIHLLFLKENTIISIFTAQPERPAN